MSRYIFWGTTCFCTAQNPVLQRLRSLVSEVLLHAALLWDGLVWTEVLAACLAVSIRPGSSSTVWALTGREKRHISSSEAPSLRSPHPSLRPSQSTDYSSVTFWARGKKMWIRKREKWEAVCGAGRGKIKFSLSYSWAASAQEAACLGPGWNKALKLRNL